ncbi:unnamed protein product [Parnassius apollo]|uniref:(apollo) hypothetical protein n=1 Tax=Parnassius apollo TaxID=110799 RepID=A0A8S3W0D3_PARAO|nr:unnamed protein product [Parnassius apollo]
MVASKNKNKVLCSTPEHRIESPSRDSDSLCDSDAASPVPFLCTQDGTEGETDVIWNHYTPKSGNAKTQSKNTTPLSRRSKKSIRPKILEKPIPKRKTVKPSQKRNELLQDLFELNQHLQEFISNKTTKSTIVDKHDIEDDIFNDSQEYSPKCGVRNNTCLRKNVLSSKFTKPEPENGIESDDSMNECLLRASQMVEENIFKFDAPKKRPINDVPNNYNLSKNPSINLKMDHDSMDAILNSIKLDSPCAKRLKKCDSPQLNNDSFDSFVGNLNDSVLERLTQMPSKIQTPIRTTEMKTEKSTELCLESPFMKSLFSRHNSMPESPSITDLNKPSTSGMVFGRYNSMPIDKNDQKEPGDSPIRCTPEEIKKKHQLAREKLLAKRQLPFTTSQTQSLSTQSVPEQSTVSKKLKFQPKVPSTNAFKTNINKLSDSNFEIPPNELNTNINTVNLKSLIEKKRQEALMKLRLRKQAKAKT